MAPLPPPVPGRPTHLGRRARAAVRRLARRPTRRAARRRPRLRARCSLADAVGDRHNVDAYDHVALDDRVTVVRHLRRSPPGDGSYDYVVLSLALMGANHVDYVREAHRLLRTDGYLWLAEPTSHLGTDEHAIRSRLRRARVRRHHRRVARPVRLRARHQGRPAADHRPHERSRQGPGRRPARRRASLSGRTREHRMLRRVLRRAPCSRATG